MEREQRPGDVTLLLHAVREGDRDALDRILPLVYDELRVLARQRLTREKGATLQPTGLVHEAYVKLAGGRGVPASDRPHFLAIAARAMRQVLVDHARKRLALRRGGDWSVTTLVPGMVAVEMRAEELLELERALAELPPRQRQVVECRYFGGMQEKEIAEALGVSERTVRREWVKARAWLYRALYPSAPGAEDDTSGAPGDPKTGAAT